LKSGYLSQDNQALLFFLFPGDTFPALRCFNLRTMNR
jgi:hypothetical protein